MARNLLFTLDLTRRRCLAAEDQEQPDVGAELRSPADELSE